MTTDQETDAAKSSSVMVRACPVVGVRSESVSQSVMMQPADERVDGME